MYSVRRLRIALGDAVPLKAADVQIGRGQNAGNHHPRIGPELELLGVAGDEHEFAASDTAAEGIAGDGALVHFRVARSARWQAGWRHCSQAASDGQLNWDLLRSWERLALW